jgi:predicted tellurium resistance membrane protein TerC
MFDWIYNPEIWAALATLTALEIVLGIDNIIFLSITTAKLPPHQQPSARLLGLAAAMLMRIGLLFSLYWLAHLEKPWFTLPLLNESISGRDVVLIGGGLFLLFKSTLEIYEKLEGEEHVNAPGRAATSYASAIIQIMILDIVFSLDSVITAIGMTDQRPIMVAAIVIAVLVMMLFAGPISRFVNSHPSVKILALSFLILIGVALIGEGFEMHIPKGYIYFAMAFSVAVEAINIRLHRKSTPVTLRDQYRPAPEDSTPDSRE